MSTPTAQTAATAVLPASDPNGRAGGRGRLFSPLEVAFMIGVPAAWGILLLFHPLGEGDFSEIIDGNVGAWLTVHLGMGVFVPLFAGVLLLLLRGVKSTAATVSRIEWRCSRSCTRHGSSCWA